MQVFDDLIDAVIDRLGCGGVFLDVNEIVGDDPNVVAFNFHLIIVVYSSNYGKITTFAFPSNRILTHH